MNKTLVFAIVGSISIVALIALGISHHQQKQKRAREMQKQEELEQIMAATNDQLRKMDSEEHAQALEKHKRAINDIGASWKSDLEKSRKHYKELDERAEAETALRQSQLELEKQKRLQGATQQ